MNLDLRLILAFLAVADLGSFRRAAERLNTTQPNISARIAKLEARLGAVLMERDAGSVRLGVTELVAHTWLRAFLVAMRDRFPEVTVELTVDMSETLSAALLEGDLDLALQSGPFERPVSGSLPLGTAPYVWVAAPGMVEGVPDAAVLARLPILTHARGTRPWRELAAHFRGQRVTPRLVPSSNLATCLQMTLDRLGIASLPRPLVETALAEGRLVELPYPWRQADLRFEARYDAERAPRWVDAAARLAQRIARRYEAGAPMADDHQPLSLASRQTISR